VPKRGTYSGIFNVLCPSRATLKAAFKHTFDLVEGKPANLSCSAVADPGSTIAQQPIVSGQSLSAAQVAATGSEGNVGGVAIRFK